VRRGLQFVELYVYVLSRVSDAHQTIKAVAQRTGLSAHVIRVWEKRYRAVEPSRTGTNRRLYSDAEVERLSLLRDLTHAGHSIGPIAALPTERLRQLASSGANGARHPTPTGRPQSKLLEEAIEAVTRLDSAELEHILNRGAVEHGIQGLLQKLIAPLAQRIGELWREGEITAAHEHFASAVIRIFLGHAAKSFVATEHAPVLVVATPHGQLHELGALLAAATAANLGWNIIYLGPSLPAAEIAGAVRQQEARAVALSIVYPEDDPRITVELERLQQLLPPGVQMLVGGRAAPSYRSALEKTGAVEMRDLAHLASTLDLLRKPKEKHVFTQP
jgi:DNA-binding transcriptional MerR regulator/methylmalonyl-CoA mutase cobalamin-binding subunit